MSGEYPYKTVVKNRTCESMAYALQSAGYSTHAIHNNNATFYSRDRVYANFGFETFTSLEYMARRRAESARLGEGFPS